MSNQIELRHFKYFLAVAEELHFRRAAEKLFLSQPGLSRQIKQMEENLGFQLFKRNNKKVELTPAGEYLQKEIRLVVKNIEHITAQAQLINEGSLGSIKMGYVGSAMQNVIPELLIRFNQAFPNIHFSLKELDNEKQVEALLNQDIDVGFVRMNAVPQPLAIRSVWTETFSIVLPKDHPLTVKEFTNLAQLKNEKFILFEKKYSPTYYNQVMSVFENSSFSPEVSHTTVHATTIFRLVENGFGISIIPSSLQLGYDMAVKFIELKDIPQRAILSMAWNKQSRNPVLQKLFHILDQKEL